MNLILGTLYRCWMWFAQHGLRNAGQLVRIGPSFGMADFISNSAILGTTFSISVLKVEPDSHPGRKKWQTYT